MSRIKRGRPSPGLVVGVVALVAALAGTAVAGPGPGATDAAQHKLTKAQKKQVNKIAKKKGKKEAKKLDKKFLPIEGKNLADGAVEASNLGSITEVTSTPTSVPIGVIGTATATCPADSKVISGGYDTNSVVGTNIGIATGNGRTDNGWRAASPASALARPS